MHQIIVGKEDQVGHEPSPPAEARPLNRALGRVDAVRRAAYRALFKVPIDEETLSQIRDTLQKGWVLGGERFKNKIAWSIAQCSPCRRGGRHGKSVRISLRVFVYLRAITAADKEVRCAINQHYEIEHLCCHPG